jgi:hypothetical protein
MFNKNKEKIEELEARVCELKKRVCELKKLVREIDKDRWFEPPISLFQNTWSAFIEPVAPGITLKDAVRSMMSLMGVDVKRTEAVNSEVVACHVLKKDGKK